MKGITSKELRTALEEAGSAHGDFETVILNGVYDEQWPGWYAAFLIGRLPSIGKPSVITRLLKDAKISHENNKEKPWPEFYADFIIDKLEH